MNRLPMFSGLLVVFLFVAFSMGVCVESSAADSDADLVPDDLEGFPPTPGQSNRYLYDSDGDGLSDGTEDANQNGARDAGETNARADDTDGDGAWDGLETSLLRTSPLDPNQPAAWPDRDGDRLADPYDPAPDRPDADADRYSDGYETALIGLMAAVDALARPALGDVSRDDSVSNVDALMIQSIFLGLLGPDIFATTNADPDRDGLVTNVDALVVQSFFLHLLSTLPLLSLGSATATPTTVSLPTATPTRTPTGTAPTPTITIGPPSVGWDLRNAGFEEGFTNGVADFWIPFAESGYRRIDWSDGTDRVAQGSHSQKVQLYQPPGIAAAGLRQTIDAVAGATYTFRARVFLQLSGEAYEGEELVFTIGIDPYGSDFWGAVIWSGEYGKKNTWISVEVTATAILSKITLYLSPLRKFGIHGDNAFVWIDDAQLYGPRAPTYSPTPTGTLPTYTPTSTPTATPPSVVGDNVVRNGSFENGFQNGLALDWQSYAVEGVGEWRSSTRIGKIGAGNYNESRQGWVEECTAMNPKTVLLMGGFGWANALGGEASRNPAMRNTIIVGRLGTDDYVDLYLSDPERYGRKHAEDCYREYNTWHPRIDCWQGLNEPDYHPRDRWLRSIRFEKAFTERAHELGMKTCVMNCATGCPANPLYMLDCRELFEIADYVGQHTYGGPCDQLMVYNVTCDDPNQYSLRFRTYERLYRERGWRIPPAIYTESTTFWGWHGGGYPGPADVREDLLLYLDYLNQDPWCVGTTVFNVGGGGIWDEWDIVGYNICAPVGVKNAQFPADAAAGLFSQMFGQGEVHPMDPPPFAFNGRFTGGVKQQVSGLVAGAWYRLSFAFKWEWRGHQPSLAFRYGLDPTGQVQNPRAGTVSWSDDLISAHRVNHETFFRVTRYVQTAGPTLSLWFEGAQAIADPNWMIYLDDVALFRCDPNWTPPGGTPVATFTQGPSQTPTPTRTTGPVTSTPTATATAVIMLTNPGFEDGFVSGLAVGWTAWKEQGTAGATYMEGMDQVYEGLRSQKLGMNGADEVRAGLYQTVPTVPGQTYLFTARARDHWTFDQYGLILSIGVDPSGGAAHTGVANWVEFSSAAHTAWQAQSVMFVATGSQATVFLRAHRKWWTGGDVWFDACSLTAE